MENTRERQSEMTELIDLLADRKLAFEELNSRMSYGMIGHVYQQSIKQPLVVIIFRGSFYSMDKDFSLNEKTLRIISLIQKLFHDLSRDEKNKPTPVFLGNKTI